MRTALLSHRARTLLGSLALLGILLQGAQAADAPATIPLELRPHCTQTDLKKCAAFGVADPQSLKTNPLAVGSVFQLDIFARAANAKVLKARTWLSYDAAVLEGTSVQQLGAFSLVTPGEADFDPAKGLVKLLATSKSDAGASGDLLPLATVTFTVKKAVEGGKTILSFYDVGGGTGHTAVFLAAEPTRNVVTEPLGSLQVLVKPAASSSSSHSSSSVAAAKSSSSSATASGAAANSSEAQQTSSSLHGAATAQSSSTLPQRTSFVLLQVQGVRATTQGSSLYLAWDALPSSSLAGYNVYYGTQTGRYIQRRSVQKDATSIEVRSLPAGVSYFLAVRGFNEANEETAFSREVSVTVSQAGTSTAPLALPAGAGVPAATDTAALGNPLEQPGKKPTRTVPGQSGTSSTLALLLLASAAVGTLFAFRRQLTVHTTPNHD